MNWREVYQAPFKLTYGYVWANNGTMSLTFDMSFDCDKNRAIMENIVKKLNGDTSIKFDKKFEYDDYIEFYYGDKYAFCIRGWGHLTGTGTSALNLPSDEAVKIQDDFAKWVLETLNS